MLDRRVGVDLADLCRGSSLRTANDMSEVWKLKGGVWNYVILMHKLWPHDPAAMIIFKVLEDSRWGAVAGEDKKLRACMIRQFFNETVDENAGRAVIRSMCYSFTELKAKWMRMVEREFPQFSAMSSGARSGGGSSGAGAKASAASGKKFLKSGGGSRGVSGPSAAGAGAGGSSRVAAGGSGGGQGRVGGQAFTTPIPRFNGLSVCWNYNKAGCTRPAHTATSCKEANSPSVFAHVCNFYDPVTKKHCYGMHSRSEPGRH